VSRSCSCWCSGSRRPGSWCGRSSSFTTAPTAPTEDWSYAEAALRGSSYLKLPRVLQFFTGNIGLHHVHHLSARIPNYNLQRAHDENPVFHDVPRLNFGDGVRALRLKLYDEDRGRMVPFREARPAPASVEIDGRRPRATSVPSLASAVVAGRRSSE
jgi:fatty acid desaturase